MIVTESITDDAVIGIQDEVAEAYGVDTADITVEVVYQTSGTIIVDRDDTISDEELVEALEDEIATLLGMHDGHVEVSIQDGVATYTITSDSEESLDSFQDALVQPETIDVLRNALPVDVTSIDVEEEINADIVVTVDTSGAENNLSSAANTLEQSFQSQGYISTAESNIDFDCIISQASCRRQQSSTS